MCVDYDPRWPRHCREPTADEVSDKTRANFLRPTTSATRGVHRAGLTAEISKSMSALEKLFRQE